jgi:hypothetical protein
MLIDAPIPLVEIEEISVTFFFQLRGALPKKALSPPLDALALSGTKRTLVEH